MGCKLRAGEYLFKDLCLGECEDLAFGIDELSSSQGCKGQALPWSCDSEQVCVFWLTCAET